VGADHREPNQLTYKGTFTLVPKLVVPYLRRLPGLALRGVSLVALSDKVSDNLAGFEGTWSDISGRQEIPEMCGPMVMKRLVMPTDQVSRLHGGSTSG
jgi:hypothetical protein